MLGNENRQQTFSRLIKTIQLLAKEMLNFTDVKAVIP